MTAAATSKWISALLAAALLSLAGAIVGMFVARARLIEASEWVDHTSEVQLSIAACSINLRKAQATPEGRSAWQAAATVDAERIGALTIDNPTQQARVTDLISRLRTFTGTDADAREIDHVLDELAAVEGTLKDQRVSVLRRATRVGWLASAVSAGLTASLITLMLAILRRQSRALKTAQTELAREGALMESVMDSMADGIMAITPERKFLHVNRAARRLLGPGFPEQIFPKDWQPNIECRYEDGSEMRPEDGALARALAGKSTDNLVYKTRQRQDPNDSGTWISASARPVRDSGGVVIAGVVALRNITTQKHQQDQLRAASMSDEMTGLHNRRGFLMLAEQHARMALRQRQPFGIAFADLNGLKAVNDLQGHEAGDRTIRAAATVLRETFRDSDIVARLGGDEFVVLLANADPSMHDRIHGRLDGELGTYNRGVAHTHTLSLSLGITFFDPEQPMPLADLMVEADRLMYVDKRARGGARG
jgi:diguanylate cyclase (GGDEF)-like protein